MHVVLLITPVFALILAGYWARRSHFIDDGFWAPAEKLGYWVLLPALIVDSVATSELPDNAGPFAVAVAVTIVVMSVPMLATRALLGWNAPSFASVHQGSIRLNGLLAIAATLALFGSPALPLIAVLVAVWVPISNGLSVYAFVAADPSTKKSTLSITVAVFKNPMIFAVLVGAVLNLIGAGLFLDQFFLFELLGRAALPIGLLTVGAALSVEHLRKPGPHVISAILLKLGIQPTIMLLLCRYLDATPLVSAVAILCAAMPSSPSGYTVARHLRGNHKLMATIITVQTLVGVVTVPLWGMYAASLL